MDCIALGPLNTALIAAISQHERGHAMKSLLFDEWLAALHHGKYQQATGKLKKGDGYCCLGVLCVVAAELEQVPEGVDEFHVLDDTIIRVHSNGEIEMSQATLPNSEKWGIPEAILDMAMKLNDETELGFVGIEKALTSLRPLIVPDRDLPYDDDA